MNVCQCHDHVTVVLKFDLVCKQALGLKHEETAQLQRGARHTRERNKTADIYQPLKTLFKINFNQT